MQLIHYPMTKIQSLKLSLKNKHPEIKEKEALVGNRWLTVRVR